MNKLCASSSTVHGDALMQHVRCQSNHEGCSIFYGSLAKETPNRMVKNSVSKWDSRPYHDPVLWSRCLRIRICIELYLSSERPVRHRARPPKACPWTQCRRNSWFENLVQRRICLSLTVAKQVTTFGIGTKYRCTNCVRERVEVSPGARADCGPFRAFRICAIVFDLCVFSYEVPRAWQTQEVPSTIFTKPYPSLEHKVAPPTSIFRWSTAECTVDPRAPKLHPTWTCGFHDQGLSVFFFRVMGFPFLFFSGEDRSLSFLAHRSTGRGKEKEATTRRDTHCNISCFFCCWCVYGCFEMSTALTRVSPLQGAASHVATWHRVTCLERKGVAVFCAPRPHAPFKMSRVAFVRAHCVTRSAVLFGFRIVTSLAS